MRNRSNKESKAVMSAETQGIQRPEKVKGGSHRLTPSHISPGQMEERTKNMIKDNEFNSNQNIRAALEYATRGWRIFPVYEPQEDGACSCENPKCQAIGKHPRITGGYKNSTTDPKQIRKWWDKWPGANIGISTGNISGIFVVDVDGSKGKEALGSLEEMYGELPNTVRATTGRGKHYFFQYPVCGSISNKSRALPKGIDIRGDGGYIVAPPSQHKNGKAYEWENEGCEIAEAPDWLLTLINGEHQADSLKREERLNKEQSEAMDSTIGFSEGQRNNGLFNQVCFLAEQTRMSEDKAWKLVQRLNGLCNPPLHEKELQNLFDSGWKYRESHPRNGSNGNLTQFEILKEEADKINHLPFMDQRGKPWVFLYDNGASPRTFSVRSSAFKSWATRIFHERTKKGLGREGLNQFANYLSAEGENNRFTLFNRFAFIEGKQYIDLCNDKGEAIEVSKDGWKIVIPDRPIFRRYSHERPLPYPAAKGNVKQILPLLNLKTERDRILLLVWLVVASFSQIQRPGLILHGTHGSGKSTFIKFVRNSLDPTTINESSPPSKNSEMVQQIDHNAIYTLDNLSGLHKWASDELCRAVTGGGSAKRQLYTDDDDVIYDYDRTFLLGGINIPSTAPDLLDRSILIELSRIDDGCQVSLIELNMEYEKALPGIFRGILDAMVEAMRLWPSIKVEKAPRMADFFILGCAAAEGLGIGQDSFVKAYYDNVQLQNEEANHGDLLCILIGILMEDRQSWEGTATDLYSVLHKIMEDSGIDGKGSVPSAPNRLSMKLKGQEHTLKQSGFDIDRARENKTRLIRIVKQV